MIGNILKRSIVVPILIIFSTAIYAQNTSQYNYAAQQAFIPAELGKVYLGMPFKEFVERFDLSTSEVGDHRFGYLPFTVQVNKGNILQLHVKIHGLDDEELKNVMIPDTVVINTDEDGKPIEPWEREILRIDGSKAPDKGFVYEMTITFKPEFDQKAYVIKTFGSKGEVREPNDEYHIFDIQWTAKTDDGMKWLVRSFHEDNSRSLMLIGRIPGTEWAPEP